MSDALGASGVSAAPFVRSQPRARAGVDIMVVLFCAVAFLGAAMVFLLEPMVVKMVLPRLGGSPAVWNTALVLFQVLLLLGYGYAHLSTKWFGVRRQSAIHLLVLLTPLAFLPVSLAGAKNPPTNGSPVVWLLVVLAAAVAVPFFVVTASAPMLSRWFSVTDHKSAADPYFLYAAGNAGSMVGLVLYPLVIEPTFTLREQSRLWFGLYIAFALLTAGAAITLRRRSTSSGTGTSAAPTTTAHHAAVGTVQADTVPVTARRRLRWILWALIPSSVMMGTTTHLSTDVAAVPLLWILPLSLYLLSFVFVFGKRNPLPVRRASRSLPYVAAALGVSMSIQGAFPSFLPLQLLLHLATLTLIVMLAHGRLAEDRPGPQHLTEFFVLMSLGGALGGMFNALIAPVLFNGVYEYPIAIAIAIALRPPTTDASKQRSVTDPIFALLFVIVVLVAAMITPPAALIAAVGLVPFLARTNNRVTFSVGALVLTGIVASMSGALLTERTFFGTMRVTRIDGFTQLEHGTTVHGKQSTDPARRRAPAMYFHQTGPLGQIFSALDGDPRLARIGILGMGVGAIAAYSQPDRHITFYEIDPAVVKVAQDPKYFTFLSGAPGPVKVVVGDGRFKVAAEKDGAFGFIIMDAFSSDSIPVHVVTENALRTYLDKLTPNGVIAINVSNKFVRMEPVVAAMARDLGLEARIQLDHVITKEAKKDGKSPSEWMVLARDKADLGSIATDRRWRQARTRSGVGPWTDDFSNIFSVLRALE